MKDEKRILRKRMKALYQDLSELEIVERSSQIAKFLDELLREEEKRWGVFAPLENEPRWHMPFKDMKFGYPFLHEQKMDFKECCWHDLITTTCFGADILTPPKQAKFITPTALLIPGLAFTKSGKRLGRGKGFYDTFLEDFSGLKIGICFTEQLLEDLPTEDHDQEMDMIITQDGPIQCSEYR